MTGSSHRPALYRRVMSLFLAVRLAGLFLSIACLITSPACGAEAAPGPSSAVQFIGAGEYQAFYLADGKIWGVGSNRAGQLGRR